MGAACAKGNKDDIADLYDAKVANTNKTEVLNPDAVPKSGITLEYFPFHGRAICLRMLLWYCGVNYENKL